MKKREELKKQPPKKVNTERKINNEILKITYVFAGMFFLLLMYFVYFQVTQASEVVNNSYNKRQENFAKKVIRGQIVSADGQVLAYTNVDADGDETRIYPFDNLFTHIVGINSHGKYGIELTNNFDLLTSNTNAIEVMLDEIEGEKSKGDNLITTLDVGLQQVAYEALGKYDGAVAVIEPDTGKILAMVSKPDYNPNRISEIWDEINKADSNESVLVNRATQGKYTPGSIFKVFTTLAYIRSGGDYEDYGFNCKGTVDFQTSDSYKINCFNYTWHGTESLKQAFANSCNGAFSVMGNEMNSVKFADVCKELLFNMDLPITLASSQSKVTLDEKSTLFDKTQTAIGQGNTAVTPIHMAMIMAAINNDGMLMKPYVVDKIETYNGVKVKEYSPSKYKDIMSEKEAKILQEYMRAVVTDGTAKGLNRDAYEAYGKTGTAELDKSGQINSWFVGYSKNDKQDLAFAVVLEDIPSGTGVASDVVKKILDNYYGK